MMNRLKQAGLNFNGDEGYSFLKCDQIVTHSGKVILHLRWVRLTDGNNTLHTLLVKHYNDFLDWQSSGRVIYFRVGYVFAIPFALQIAWISYVENVKLFIVATLL